MSTISPNAVDETGENNTVLRRRLIFYDTIRSGRSNKDMLIIIIIICIQIFRIICVVLITKRDDRDSEMRAHQLVVHRLAREATRLRLTNRKRS